MSIWMLLLSCCFGVGLQADDPPKKKKQSLEDVFKKLDKNSDGKVTLDEFKAFPAIKNKEAAAKAFKAADADGDGSLSLDEFRDWAERMTERRREKTPPTSD
jgi:Ca2+-binding EF-hand superfamily protein